MALCGGKLLLRVLYIGPSLAGVSEAVPVPCPGGVVFVLTSLRAPWWCAADAVDAAAAAGALATPSPGMPTSGSSAMEVTAALVDEARWRKDLLVRWGDE
jgi:hypothetical protein